MKSGPPDTTEPISASKILLTAVGFWLVLLPGCEFESGPPPVPASLSPSTGIDQSSTVGTPVPVPPGVTVLNRKGRPMEGRTVVFTMASGGGHVTGGVTVTDKVGFAQVTTWVLGPTAGPQMLQARVEELTPILFTATGLAASPATVRIQNGNAQLGIVASALPEKPSVLVKDVHGHPVPEATVDFLVIEGGGFLSQTRAQTNDLGMADGGNWTMGTIPGPNTMRAIVQGVAPAAFSAMGVPDAPSRITVLVGGGQTGKVAMPLPLRPTIIVADRFGNLLEGTPVIFQVATGGGSISGGQQVSGPMGVAVSGRWTLGSTAGPQTLEVRVAGLDPVTLGAVAEAGPPAALHRLGAEAQVALVGAPVPDPPGLRVEDSFGNPIEGVSIAFSISRAPDLGRFPGSVQTPAATSDPDGKAWAGSWILGVVAGDYELEAGVLALGEVVTFSATASNGPPEAMVALSGAGQMAPVGTQVAIPLSVRVVDEFGNGVPDVPVSYSVIQGGGEVSGTGSMTNEAGVASLGEWRLGPAPGINQLLVDAPDLPPIVFSATGLDQGQFDLDLEFLTAVDPSLLPAFQGAVARWEEIVVGDIPDFLGSLSQGGCQPVAEGEGIDDVKVYVTVKTIDGVGGVLGRAGPCYYRTVGGPFPITGIMELDQEDLASLLASGMLEGVIIHEMGHILGFGTLWNVSSNSLLEGAGTVDPHFTGLAAIAAFDAAGGGLRTGTKVPVENTGGPGTRDGHWRESVHNAELMTGWIEGGGATNPLSAITIASLADMGYTVNMAVADPYVLFNPVASPPRVPSASWMFIRELPPPVPIPAPGGSR